MHGINFLSQNYILGLTVALGVVFIILLIMLVQTRAKLTKLKKKYDFFTKGSDMDIDEVLTKTIVELQETKEELAQLTKRHDDLRQQVRGCIQKVKIDRYDAYDLMGGELSYSLVLADEDNNGVVMSSIYGRDDNRCYAKEIIAGQSKYPFADEEKALVSKL